MKKTPTEKLQLEFASILHTKIKKRELLYFDPVSRRGQIFNKVINVVPPYINAAPCFLAVGKTPHIVFERFVAAKSAAVAQSRDKFEGGGSFDDLPVVGYVFHFRRLIPAFCYGKKLLLHLG
jgi:hypothetical protein